MQLQWSRYKRGRDLTIIDKGKVTNGRKCCAADLKLIEGSRAKEQKSHKQNSVM